MRRGFQPPTDFRYDAGFQPPTDSIGSRDNCHRLFLHVKLHFIDNKLPAFRYALGRKLDDPTLRLAPKGFKAIGDAGLFADLSKRDYTDINNPKEPRVWRLLLERGNWIYLFPALTQEQQKDPKARPPVMAIQQSQSGDQLLIISPEPSKQSK